MASEDLVESEIINFRGNWKEDTIYEVGDYVYLDNNCRYLYKCIQRGKSQGKLYGYTSSLEPEWKFSGNVYEEYLVWKAVKRSSIKSAYRVQRWKPDTMYYVGEYVIYEDGTMPLFDGEEYLFLLDSILIDHKWTTVPEEYQQDGTVVWECYLSIGYFLPAERLKERTFVEFVQMLDYLILHEKVYFDDFYYKYKDVTKVRTKSLREIVCEEGFKYIADVLELTRKEAETLVQYISVINDLKGSQAGLEVVFNIIGIKYEMTEWWEKNPQGIPHTFDIGIEVDIDKVVKDMIKLFRAFVRNYVYPVIASFQVTYKISIAEAAALMAGFIDIEIPTYAERGLVAATQGGFIDITYNFDIVSDIKHYAIMGGFVDIEIPVTIESVPATYISTFGYGKQYIDMKAIG